MLWENGKDNTQTLRINHSHFTRGGQRPGPGGQQKTMTLYRWKYALATLLASAGLSVVACNDDGTSPADEGGDTGSGGRASGGASSGGESSGGRSSGGRDSGGTSNLGGGGFGGGSGGTIIVPDPDFCPEDSTTPEDDEISGEIDDHVCLTAGRDWFLGGYVFVVDGGKLTIEPGAVIRGHFAPSGEPSVLVVSRGGQIDAEGEANKPIVFTSEFEPGQRFAGDWGGVVLLGKATNNVGESRIEGFTVPGTDTRVNHGGTEDDDNSGTLAYVRIEFAGVDLGDGDEINGLTMGSVGSGTTIHHVQVASALDDGFEWFGGTVDLEYLVVNNAGDDMFDADQGYNGKLTNIFGRHINVSSADPNGFEWDNNVNNTDATPRTFVEVENATLCAGNLGITSRAAVLRRGISGAITNLVAVGFTQGYSLRNNNWVIGSAAPVSITGSTLFGFTGTQAHLADGAFGFTNGTDTTADAAALAEALAWFDDGTGNTLDAPPFTLANCINGSGPTGAVRNSGVGAFKNGDWLTGAWLSWAED